jgi:hypothetical protein
LGHWPSMSQSLDDLAVLACYCSHNTHYKNSFNAAHFRQPFQRALTAERAGRAQPLPKAGPWSDKLDHPATPLPSFANSNTATTIVIVNPLLVSAPLIIWEWR